MTVSRTFLLLSLLVDSGRLENPPVAGPSPCSSRLVVDAVAAGARTAEFVAVEEVEAVVPIIVNRDDVTTEEALAATSALSDSGCW
jgi:hypothetical protein